MRYLRITLLVAVGSTLATACGYLSSGGTVATRTVPAARTLRLLPGHYTYPLGHGVHVGQRIRCVTRTGAPAGGGYVPKRGRGVGSSTGFSVFTFPSGKVKITCPAHPGNA
jgi:hypothetical protein